MNSKPPDLSILICSVAERHDNFAVAIQRQIYDQIAKLDDPSRVEVLVLTDTRSMSIGTKRNHLVRMASGRYTVFVDDDDEVADHYVAKLLEATASDADVLTFQLEYRLNGIKRWITRQSIRYTDDHVNKLNTPRHTSAVRRDIALQLPFVESSYGEDADWAKRLLTVAKTERVINEALYIYCDVPATSVARQYAAEHSPNAYRQWLDAQPKQDYSLGRRLGNHMTSTLQHALTLKPKGTALEFGVGQGKTLRMIAQHMPVIGFDSFQGLPADWEPGRFEKGHFACEPPQVDNATLVVGLFEDTLPTFQFPDDAGLVHIDCDLYSSTMTVLNHLEPHLPPGCILVFDEYHGAKRCIDHEQRAFREYAERTGIKWTVIGHGPEQWSIRLS